MLIPPFTFSGHLSVINAMALSIHGHPLYPPLPACPKLLWKQPLEMGEKGWRVTSGDKVRVGSPFTALTSWIVITTFIRDEIYGHGMCGLSK
jgi:hypothetical protein